MMETSVWLRWHSYTEVWGQYHSNARNLFTSWIGPRDNQIYQFSCSTQKANIGKITNKYYWIQWESDLKSFDWQNEILPGHQAFTRTSISFKNSPYLPHSSLMSSRISSYSFSSFNSSGDTTCTKREDIITIRNIQLTEKFSNLMKIGSATLTDQRTRSKAGSMRASSQNRKSLHAAALEVLALYLGHFSELKLKADQSCSRGAPIAQLLGNSMCPPKW